MIHFQVHGAGKTLFGDGFAVWYTKDRNKQGKGLRVIIGINEVLRVQGMIIWQVLLCMYKCYQLTSDTVCMLSVLLWSCIGPVFGNQDFFVGLGVFFDTYSNHNGEHSVSRLVYYHSD